MTSPESHNPETTPEPVVTIPVNRKRWSQSPLVLGVLTVLNGLLQVSTHHSTAEGSRATGQWIGLVISPWVISAVIAAIIFYILKWQHKPNPFKPLWLRCTFWVLILSLISALSKLGGA